jgi:hypothetical protein
VVSERTETELADDMDAEVNRIDTLLVYVQKSVGYCLCSHTVMSSRLVHVLHVTGFAPHVRNQHAHDPRPFSSPGSSQSNALAFIRSEVYMTEKHSQKLTLWRRQQNPCVSRRDVRF